MGVNGGKWGGGGMGKWGNMRNHQQIRMENVGETSSSVGEKWGRTGGKWQKRGRKMAEKWEKNGTEYPFFRSHFPHFPGDLPYSSLCKKPIHRTHRWKNGKFFHPPTLTATAASADARYQAWKHAANHVDRAHGGATRRRSRACNTTPRRCQSCHTQSQHAGHGVLLVKEVEHPRVEHAIVVAQEDGGEEDGEREYLVPVLEARLG